MTENEKAIRKDKIRTRIVFTVGYILLALLVITSVVPFWIVLINATRDGMSISTQGLTMLPGSNLKANYQILTDNVNVIGGFLNSVKISILITVLSSYFSALTAYGFYMYKFKANKFLFGVIVVFMMVPNQLAFLGFIKWITALGLMDTHMALIIPSIASIGTVFFLRQFISATLSKSIIESARIDGANEMFIFHKIGLPLMAPGIATMAIFTFIGSWNSFLLPRVVISSKELETLPVVISSLKALKIWHQNQGAIYLGFAISIVPIVIVFLFASKYLIEGIGAGAVKG